MGHDRFVRERDADWRELEELLATLDRKGWQSLRPAQLDRLSVLYLTASADLAVAARRYPQGRTHQYLNSLVARAHARLYSTTTTTWRQVWRFFAHDLPAAFWRSRGSVALAFAVFMAGACLGYALMLWQPAYGMGLLPVELQEVIRTGWTGPAPEDGTGDGGSFVFSSLIMINNIRVSILALGLGLTFGVGTAYVLLMNGALLGALAAVMPPDWRAHLWSLLAPHGVPELLAIFIAGGAGFRLAWGLIRPGDERRLDSLSRQGREAMLLFALVVPLLVLAGLVEGLLTPAALPRVVKFGFAALAAVALAMYLRPRSEPPPKLRPEPTETNLTAKPAP